MRGFRVATTLCLAIALLAAGPAAALAATPPAAVAAATAELATVVHASRAGAVRTVSTSIMLTASPAACSDGKYNLLGPRWKSTLRWSFKASTIPLGLGSSAVLATLKRGFANIVNARNDCGRADRVGATVSYLGTTTSKIGVTSAGRCGAANGRNVVGFGILPVGVLGVTCIRSVGSRIVEIDIRFNRAIAWTLGLAGCLNRFMLEAVATHEAGHAFGLDHVSEAKHGRLTMSTYIDGPCQNSESTLGLGDLRGLEALY